MDSSRFVDLMLDLHNKYGNALGINDVYAYSALGRVIKAVGTVIISPNSPLVITKVPKTISMYLLSNNTVLALVDLPIEPRGLDNCVGEQVEITNDLHKPPNKVTAINITNCLGGTANTIFRIGREHGIRLEVWLYRELGMESVKLVFRGYINDLRTLAKLVIIMTALSNVGGMGELNEAVKIINNVLGIIRNLRT
ncbi:MAG: hypothetical protein ACP5GY_03105 [Vulcanisaeta sp.]